jgi:glutamate/tyrosine decarboxylase-like PLP-dependent enzyme
VPVDPLERAQELARAFLRRVSVRHAGARGTLESLRRELGGPLPERGCDAAGVVEALAAGADAGLVASAGPRYFGFVTGGSLPAAVGADWLTSAWDQNSTLVASSPAAAVIEEVVAGWILDLAGLPQTASVGLVTGCQMANFTGLAAARHAVLEREGWDLPERGLRGAPRIRVLVGAEAHVTVHAALRMLGFGARDVVTVEADGQGRMMPGALASAIGGEAPPLLVCAQAGNVNTGACDPLEPITEIAHARGAWLHVDGAFGLWAAVVPARRHLVRGIEGADSWATDAHKWLNVPYDCGIAIVTDTDAHRAAMSSSAAYLVRREQSARDPLDWVPEASRRARAFPLYAALRSLGRRGVEDLVERCCHHAALMADLLRADPRADILNDVVLNQVLVRFHDRPRDSSGSLRPDAALSAASDELTQAVIDHVQRAGVCWVGGTSWHDVRAMRISISNWSTTEGDIRQSATAILDAARTVRVNLL